MTPDTAGEQAVTDERLRQLANDPLVCTTATERAMAAELLAWRAHAAHREECSEQLEGYGECTPASIPPDIAAAKARIDELEHEQDAARACVAELEAERDRARRAAEHLGGLVDRQCRDVLDATGMHHVIDADGDGDWGLVWERLAEMGAERARVAELEAERDTWREPIGYAVGTHLGERMAPLIREVFPTEEQARALAAELIRECGGDVDRTRVYELREVDERGQLCVRLVGSDRYRRVSGWHPLYWLAWLGSRITHRLVWLETEEAGR